jgi:arylsulfatase A-like enzyme
MTAPLTRRNLLKALGAGAALAAAPQAWSHTFPVGHVPRRPNIVLVMTDDQGYGDIGCHGNEKIKTPNLDALHAKSLRFTDFHVSPTCAPTRCSIMTGRHEFRSGVTHTIYERERMSPDAVTLPAVLKAAGYTSGIFGKWHLGDQEPYQPGSRGFDEVFIHGAGGIGQTYRGSCGDAPGNKYFDPAIRHNGTFVRTKGYCTDIFFTQALRWIKGAKDGGKPFFAYITTNAPHGPLQCPEKYFKPYMDAGMAESDARFYGMITNIDDNMGVLMDKLAKWNLLDNTLVVFMTDNGSARAGGGRGGSRLFNAGMKGKKGTPNQGGTRVPGFFYWKGQTPSGVDCNALTAHIDLLPTFAELAGGKVPAKVKLDGRSLVPLLKDPKAKWADRYLFTHVGRWRKGQIEQAKFSKCAVRNARFRLVNNKELYDIAADPGETTNVIDRHPEVVAAMRKAYDQWWSEVVPAMCNEDAPVPEANPFKVLYAKQEASAQGIPAWPVRPKKEEL